MFELKSVVLSYQGCSWEGIFGSGEHELGEMRVFQPGSVNEPQVCGYYVIAKSEVEECRMSESVVESNQKPPEEIHRFDRRLSL